MSETATSAEENVYRMYMNVYIPFGLSYRYSSRVLKGHGKTSETAAETL